MKEETAPLALLQIALSINRSNLEKIDWMEEFINYIEKHNIKLYKKAREYADELERNGYWTEEEKKIWGMKEETKYSCCGDEVTQEVKETGRCPSCKENI